MIQERVRDIIRTEQEADEIIKNARIEAAELVKNARYKADEMIIHTRNTRKETVNKAIRETEERAHAEAVKILDKAETDASIIRKDTEKNWDPAVLMVFEKVVNYGNK